MIYAILILVYLLGMASMFYHSMAIDELTMIRHGRLGKFSKFTSYLVLCAFWPVTTWVQMFFRWLQVRDEAKLDRSAWLFCSECFVKWRPTAYGPPTPDDCICPVCEVSTNVQQVMDRYSKITRFEDGVQKRPWKERR